MAKEEFNRNNGPGPDAHALLEEIEAAIERRDPSTVNKKLEQLVKKHGEENGVPERLLTLGLKAKESNPALAIDIISGGVLNDNTQGKPIREEAAKNLLSLSVDNRLEPDAALFAAWRASDNLDPASAAGQAAIDRIADLAKRERSAVSVFYLRKVAARAPENTIAGDKARTLWLRLVNNLDDGQKLEDTRNMAWEAKPGSLLQNEAARLWGNSVERFLNSGSLDRAFMETEITLCNERTTGTLRQEAHKFWLEALRHYAAKNHRQAIAKAVATNERLYGSGKNHAEMDAAREYTAGVLLDLADFAPDSRSTFTAVIAAAAYSGKNTELHRRIAEELTTIVRAPHGFSRQQTSQAAAELRRHNSYLERPGGGTGWRGPAEPAPGF